MNMVWVDMPYITHLFYVSTMLQNGYIYVHSASIAKHILEEKFLL
jgi:hypothetical protein